MSSTPRYVGVDGASDGWVAVRYDRTAFHDVCRYDCIGSLWAANRSAETILVDVPIGLADDRAARDPETEARKHLEGRRSSVFNVPIRPVLGVTDYEEANRRQREAIGKGLQKQTHNVVPKIRAVDDLFDETEATQAVVREAHPEVCLWALAGGEPMAHSKTGQPAAAFWERVAVLESVHDDPVDFHDALFAAGETVREWNGPKLSNDDLLDAFALAVTASDLTGALRTLPEEPTKDAEGLRMEMVYAEP